MKILFIILLFQFYAFSQEWSFGFYNVENLFDTIDDKNKEDEDFLPQSERRWSAYRYYTKLNKISQVIRAITEKNPPILFGLCEIENIEVLNDLVKRKAIKKHNYIPITFESPDKRGIQTALLYKKDFFLEIESKPIKVSNEDEGFFTRDILYVKGKLINEDTLHIFVCHFPSRRGGKNESEDKRIHASNILLNEINNVENKNPNIIICGDFNDEPFDRSILNIVENSKFKLINTSKEMEGTHIFQGHWGILDQIIVSEKILEKTKDKKSFVFKNKFLMERDSKNESPFPTYRFIFYKNGYSDHFPIFIKFNQ